MFRLRSLLALAVCVLALFSVAASAATPPPRSSPTKIAPPPPPGGPPPGGGPVPVNALDQGENWILLTVPGSGTTVGGEEEIPIEPACPPWGCPTPGFAPSPEDEPIVNPDLHVYVLHGQAGVLESPLPPTIQDDLLAEGVVPAPGVMSIDEVDAIEGDPLYIVRQDIVEGIEASEASGILTPEIAAIAELSPVAQSSCALGESSVRKVVSLSGHDFGKTYNLGGGFSGSFALSGNLEGAVTAELNFYVKRKKLFAWCVPYGVEFKNVHIFGDATANAGVTLSGTIAYQHSFGPVEFVKPELFSVLFFVGPVPVYVGFNLPISAGLDVSAQGTGSVTYNGSRIVTGTFDWVCTLDECHGDGEFDNNAADTTQTLTGGVSGRLKPEPYADIGFRAYLYTEFVAYLQAGLQPRLLGDLWGYTGNNCGDALGDGTFEPVHGLTFDLDRRVDLTGQASVLGLDPWRRTLKTGSVSHIGFYDLGSNAMQPELLGSATGRVGSPSEYLVKIRPCWPYDKKVTYRVNWGDNSPEVELESDPAAYARFSHTWTAAGSRTITATSVKDKHGRALNQSTTRVVGVVDCNPPVISVQPLSVTINSGQTATLSVTSTGTTFQWYRGSSGDTANPVPGGTAGTIVVTPSATTSYWVRVFGPCSDPLDSGAATVTVDFACTVSGSACGGDGHHTCLAGQCVCTDCGSPVCCGAAGSPFCDGQPHADPNTGYSGVCASVLPGCSAANDYNGGNLLYHAGAILGCVKYGGVYQWFPSRPSPRCQEVSPVCGFLCSTHYNNGAGFQCDPSGVWNQNPPLAGCYGGTIPAGWSCQPCVAPQITSQPQPVTIVEGQSATLAVQASGTSPTFQWYVGSSGNTSSPIPGATESSRGVTPSATTSYWVRVSNACGQANSQTVTVTVNPSCEPPAITSQPQSVTITTGATAALSVTASGTALQYQWYRGAVSDISQPVAGGSGATLFVSPSTTTSYWVRVWNACGTSSSGAATVTVTCGANGAACGGDGHHTCQAGQCVCTDCGSAVCCGAAGSTFCDGQAHSDPSTGYSGACASTLPGCSAASDFNGGNTLFNSGEVKGCVKYNGVFQWYPRRPSPRCQEVSPVCGFLCATHYNNGAGFQCDSNGNWNQSPPLAGCYGGTIPAGWSCQTCVAPQITSQPQPATIVEGQSATLAVQASGTSPTFQWYVGSSGDTSSPIPGAAGSSRLVTPSATTSYWVRVSNACGQANSQTVTVTVNPSCEPPYITSQPQPAAINPGATAALSVSAAGTPPLHFQWYEGVGSPVSGGSGATLFVSPSSNTSYWVQVSNDCGFADSIAAAVTFNCGPNGAACGGDGHHTCQAGQCTCTDCGSSVCCGASGNAYCNGQAHFDPNTGYSGTCSSSLPGCSAANDFDGGNTLFHEGEVVGCVKRNGSHTWMARRPSPRCQEVAAVCDYLCANHYNGGSGFQCGQDGWWSQSPLGYCFGGTVPASYLCP